MPDVTASVLAEAARARIAPKERARLEYIVFLHDTLTQVHSDLRREADHHRYPVFLLDFALLRTYLECRHTRSSAYRTLGVLFRPGITTALPVGARLELLKYILSLADDLGPEFKEAMRDLVERLRLAKLLRQLPGTRDVGPEASKLAVTDDMLQEIGESFRSAEESCRPEKAVRHRDEVHRDVWEKAESLVDILEKRVEPLTGIAGEEFELDSDVYGQGLYLLSSKKGRQQKTYNNRADALNLAVAHSLTSRELRERERNGATPYFLLVTPDKAVYEAFSEIPSESVGGALVRHLIYAFFRQLIACSRPAAQHPEDSAWQLRLAAEEELRSFSQVRADEQRVSWCRGGAPGVINAANEIWRLAERAGIEDDFGWPVAHREPRPTLLSDFTRELERCAPSPSETFLLETLVREPHPVEWSQDGRPTRLIMRVKKERVAECEVAERYISVWLDSTAGFERFLGRVNHIWRSSHGQRRRIAKMFEGVDIVTGSGSIEIPPERLPPPWTVDDIWDAAGDEIPLVVRMNTDGFDAWYETRQQDGRLTARCGVMTHRDLYLGISELLRECVGEQFSPGECATYLRVAVCDVRRKVFVANQRPEDP